jgi:hypothetical protein
MAAIDNTSRAGAALTSDPQSGIASYVEQAAALLGIDLDSERRDGVVAAFTSYHDAATLLMEFPLAIDVEQASVYALEDASEDW